ncbi:MAG TPA: hypothetical protein VIV12_29090, partial [Streptosporangiaceae bacterium]
SVATRTAVPALVLGTREITPSTHRVHSSAAYGTPGWRRCSHLAAARMLERKQLAPAIDGDRRQARSLGRPEGPTSGNVDQQHLTLSDR